MARDWPLGTIMWCGSKDGSFGDVEEMGSVQTQETDELRQSLARYLNGRIKKDGKSNTGRRVQGSLELGKALRATDCSRQSSGGCQSMAIWETSMKLVLHETGKTIW